MVGRAQLLNVHSYLSLFDGFIDFWEASARLAEAGEFGLQILYHYGQEFSISPTVISKRNLRLVSP